MRNEIEVMRVVRVPPMGKLVVQVGDRRAESLLDVRDEGARGRIMTAIGELVSFAGGYEALVEIGVAPPLPQAESARPGPRSAEASLTAEQEAFLTSLEEELKATVQTGPLPPLAAPRSVDLELETPATPAPEPSQNNLVAEIDEILQQHVARNPDLSGRAIHLEQPLSGTLQIRVDNRTYEHPNEIEDATVRQVIKRALQEWELR